MHITTPLTRSELLIAWWRTGHLLYGSYYHMSDAMQYPQDALARQILTDGFLKEPSGYINGNLSGAFGFAGIKPEQISPETLALAQHCGLTHTGDAVWTYDSADDHRTPDEIAAVRASIAAAESAPVSSPAAPAPDPAPNAPANDASGSAPAQPPIAAPAPAAPIVLHAGHASKLREIADAIEHGAVIAWHEVEAAIRAIARAL